MYKFIVISNNMVVNIIVADSLEIAETVTNSTCLEYSEDTNAAIGSFYDETTKTFSNPTVPSQEIL